MKQHRKDIIRQARKLKGWSLRELGEKVGRNLNTIKNWELGYTSMSDTDFDKVKQVLEITEKHIYNCKYNNLKATVDDHEDRLKKLETTVKTL